MTKLNPQPAKTKSLTKGRKSPETPKAALKRAKKKETGGQTTLTSEPLTMKSQRKRGGDLNPKNPKRNSEAKKKKKRKIKNL